MFKQVVYARIALIQTVPEGLLNFRVTLISTIVQISELEVHPSLILNLQKLQNAFPKAKKKKVI